MDNDNKKILLRSYLTLRADVEQVEERLTRLRSEAELPPMRMGDGSKHTGGSGDRMERAIARRMEYEEKHAPRIREKRRRMEAIEDAVEALDDPLERAVLRMRYLDSDNSRLVRWNEVAAEIFGDDDEKYIRAVHRIHGGALNNIDLEGVEK